MHRFDEMMRRFEYKRFFHRKIWICIVFCFLLQLIFMGIKYKESPEDVVYQEVLESYCGLATVEKIEEITEKTIYYEQTLAEYKWMVEQYARNEITDAQFFSYMEEYKYAKQTICGWQRLNEHAHRFLAGDGTYYFFYDVSWEKLFAQDSQWLYTILLVLLLLPYYYRDRDVRCYEMTHSYCGFYQVEKYRLCYGVCVAVIIQIVCVCIELFMALTMSRLPDYMATAKSLFVGTSISEVNRVTGMRILGDDGILSLGFLSAVIEYCDEVTLLTFLILRVGLLILKRVVDVVFLNLCACCMKNKMQAAVVVLGVILGTNVFF